MKRSDMLLARARSMRSDMPEPERRLWAALRAWRLDGVKFSRQVPVGGAILDFAARREKLAIEVDGDSHADRVEADRARDARLRAIGYRVLRFTNDDVTHNLEGVLETILGAVRSGGPSPLPSPRRGEGDHGRDLS